MGKRCLRSCMLVMLACLVGAGTGSAQPTGSGKFSTMTSAVGPPIHVDGTVALASLITIGDAHLAKIADTFKAIATREQVATGDWDKVKPVLAAVAPLNVAGLFWFALPSGEYWTLEQGRTDVNLKSRSYFPRLLAGKTVIGDLVVSKATGKNVAVVAVPVLKEKNVVGILGCSVYLDQLSEKIKQEMALPPGVIFYSFDSKPLLALVWDKDLIFKEPKDLGQEVDKAFQEMLGKEQGQISYSFQGKRRTVVFKKSPVTNWWYAFGVVRGNDGNGSM